MKHTYIDTEHSRFLEGSLRAEVEFGGDVHVTRDAEIQDVCVTVKTAAGPLDITRDFHALCQQCEDHGLASPYDLFRALHCPHAARDLGR